MKYRVGDEVEVRGTVKVTGTTGWMTVDFGDVNRCPCVDPDRIVKHTPRAIQVGDYVTKPDNDVWFRVIAIDGDTAWVREPFGPNELVKHRTLTPTDPPC